MRRFKYILKFSKTILLQFLMQKAEITQNYHIDQLKDLLYRKIDNSDKLHLNYQYFGTAGWFLVLTEK